ncbi:hypothetical protein DL96DRAFT_1527725 [Flagelloscypha sp. PMI_526]|nr:hypothetical protein DL96DRAFT_1527725 [Flagelloscypha sp. PMI_526]
MPKVNTLTTNMTAKFGPIVFETMIKHYFDRAKRELSGGNNGTNVKPKTLKEEEFLYQTAFNVVKSFLYEASHHTVEECQGFSNTPTPSSPWIQTVRVLVPRSSCDKAAELLITAFGGKDGCHRTVGGTKWWQVRSLDGVDGEWITARKDWKEYKRRAKEKKKSEAETDPKQDSTGADNGNPLPEAGVASEPPPEGVYDREMDDMRCILYAHGGGYYFGSIDQHRYSLQRHARKINGRVFAVNYRLAPQYPFPCALQDLLAAYLYLIDPPPDAKHKPVNPAQIVVAGDSAGGGLTIALLQIIRDSPGIPLPAGAILISPWCDLTHSFPSIHTNTDTDVIPAYGLCMQKPSTVWPPPSDDLTSRMQISLRSRLRQALKLDDPTYDPTVTMLFERPSATGMPIDVGATTRVPAIDKIRPNGLSLDGKIEMKAQNGETLVIDQQVQLYTENSLVTHPLVSSCAAYLGGLPPLMIMAGDGEVLRDEIIYMAHRAQYPEKYPLRDEARQLYPPNQGIEQRHPKPTQVHLQVYDDAPHVLPVLFLFTIPAKFCYRAMAQFCRHVMTEPSPLSPLQPSFSLSGFNVVQTIRGRRNSKRKSSFSSISGSTPTPQLTGDGTIAGESGKRRGSSLSRRSSIQAVKRTMSVFVPGASKKLSRSSSLPPQEDTGRELVVNKDEIPKAPPSAFIRRESDQDDVAGPRFRRSPSPIPIEAESAEAGTSRPDGLVISQALVETPASEGLPGTEAEVTTSSVKYAGEAAIYGDRVPWRGGMIRERVSIQGVTRPLEQESELTAFSIPEELVCQLSELAVRRFLEARAKFDKKYGHILKRIEKQRRSHIERSKVDTIRHLSALRSSLLSSRDEKGKSASANGTGTTEDTDLSLSDLDASSIISAGSFSFAWALDDDERPPPSSIVARRDTHEARQLAKVADRSLLGSESMISGNTLWTSFMNMMSNPPEKVVNSVTFGRRTSARSGVNDTPMKRRLSKFIGGGSAVRAREEARSGESPSTEKTEGGEKLPVKMTQESKSGEKVKAAGPSTKSKRRPKQRVRHFLHWMQNLCRRFLLPMMKSTVYQKQLSKNQLRGRRKASKSRL